MMTDDNSGPAIVEPEKNEGTATPAIVEPEKKAKKTRGPNKKKSNSPEQSRAEKDGARAPRIPMGHGGNLKVSPAILAEIKASGRVPRWCLDDGEGKIEQYINAYWEFYTDANGDKLSRPAKNGHHHVLMTLDKVYYDEDKKLKRQKNRDTLADNVDYDPTGAVPDYVPDGRQHVISSEM